MPGILPVAQYRSRAAAPPSGGVGKGSREFDGVASYLIVADSPAFDFSSGITLAAWVKCSGLTSNNGIFGKSTDVQFRLINGTVARCQLSNGVDVRGTTDILNSGQWHHVVMTWDLSTARFYTDANEEDTQAIATAFNKGATEWHIGKYSSQEWDGNLADVRVYNRALDAGEVAALAACPLPGYTDEAGAWLGDADDLSDLSGNGNNATEGDGGNPTVYLPTGPCDTAYKPTFGNASREFDGVGNWVTVPSSDSITFSGAGSYCIWIKPETFANSTRVFSQRSISTQIEFYSSSGALAAYNGSGVFTSGVTPTNGEWLHAVLIFDGAGNGTWFINGIEVTTTGYSLSGAPDLILEIGRYNVSGVNKDHFNGNLADFRIYNRALTAQEISDIYNDDNASPIRDGQVGQWITDENEPPVGSDTIIDWSGNGNDGQNGGSAYDGADGPFV